MKMDTILHISYEKKNDQNLKKQMLRSHGALGSSRYRKQNQIES